MKRGMACIGLLGLAACVSNSAVKVAPMGKSFAVRERIDFPDIGTVAEARPGQELLRQGTFTEIQGVELHRPNKIEAYELSAGFYPKIREDDKYTYHSFRMGPNKDGFGYIPPARSSMFKDLQKAPHAIRVAKHKRETCVLVRDLLRSACDTEHGYSRVTYTRLTPRDLQQELVYTGREGDRIRVAYREESGHYARPEYWEEAVYDLTRSKIIAYKGARIRVLDAEDDVIRYQVLSKLTGW
jgi:hypothetical protein